MRQMRLSSTIRFLTFTTATGALALLALGGCYNHVVRAEGPGSETYKVYPPNLQEEEPAAKPEQPKTQKVPSKKAPSEKAATKEP